MHIKEWPFLPTRLTPILTLLLALAPTGAQGAATFSVLSQDVEGATIICEIDPQQRESLRRYLALPEGATAEIEILAREGAALPGEAVALQAAGQIRGVDVALLEIDPLVLAANGETHRFPRIELRITFTGGSGDFGEPRLRNHYWDPILQELLLNHASLPPIEPADARDTGYDYVIISPDQAEFVAWADSMAVWRKLQGIRTEVFTTTATGQTAAEIETWLNEAYNTWEIPPAGFLLLGDYENSGDRNPGIPAPVYAGYCISDNVYADVDGDNLPDMVGSRIAAQTGAEAGAMIAKQLAYERQPPMLPCYYAHPVVSGAWSGTGMSILVTEAIRGFWEYGLGKAPLQEYVLQGEPPVVWPDEAWAAYFGPTGLQYIPGDPTYLNDWGGNAARINGDINAGAFMVLYRGHGLAQGWGAPSYTVADLSGLTNEHPPFVISSACLTGQFNYPAPCFAEAFHRRMEGALGVIAPSEVLYSFPSDIFTWCVIDGIWEDFMPDLRGSGDLPGSVVQRTAFAHAQAKYALEALPLAVSPATKDLTYHLFHHHGDAFLTLHSEVPTPLTVVHGPYLGAGLDRFPIQADEGALVGLTVDGEIIGVGEATGMMVEIIIEPQSVGSVLRITVTKVNHVRYDATIPVAPSSDAGDARAMPRLHLAAVRSAAGPVEIFYALPTAARGRLSIFDTEGRLVRTLADEMMTAGRHRVTWNGGGAAGGLYFCRLEACGQIVSQRILLVE